MIDIVKSLKMVFLKYQKQRFINQFKNQKQASLKEAIDTISSQLLLFDIFQR